jgi:hypothetical protein
MNTLWFNYSTFNVEVGVSQDWKSPFGLDRKAQKWFNSLHMYGLQYILCIRIAKTKSGHTLSLTYKLYDVSALNGVFPNPTPNPIIFTQSAAIVNLDARRLLGIPPNYPLPQGVVDTFTIDLAYIRDRAAAKGY